MMKQVVVRGPIKCSRISDDINTKKIYIYFSDDKTGPRLPPPHDECSLVMALQRMQRIPTCCEGHDLAENWFGNRDGVSSVNRVCLSVERHNVVGCPAERERV